MHYYHHNGASLVSFDAHHSFGPEIAPVAEGRLFFLIHGDPILGRSSFKVTHPGQLVNPHGLEGLDASRLPGAEVDEAVCAAIAQGRLTAVNMDRPGWEELLTLAPTGIEVSLRRLPR